MQNKKSNKKVQRKPQNVQMQQAVKNAVSAALKQVAPAMNPKGNSFLGDIGQFAGNGISKIFGLGAYKITRNSLYSAQTGAQVPFMHSQSESVVFRHREYIGEISSSAAFTTQVYPVNPGLSSTFPYLSTIASCFEEYKFRGLIFEFKSTGADAIVNGTNSSLGTVGLAAQYRSDAQPLGTKVEFLNQMWATDTKTSEHNILPIECAPKENAMAIQYVRSGAAIGDIKNYDLCQLVVATSGSPGVNVVGELWASYEIELFKPTVTPTGGVLAADHVVRQSTTGNTMLGSIQLSVPFSTIGVVLASNTITFPANCVGRYLVTITHSGTAAVIAGPATSVTNGSLVNYTFGATAFAVPANGINSTGYTLSCVVRCDTSIVPCVLTFGSCTLPSSAQIDITVAELPDSII